MEHQLSRLLTDAASELVVIDERYRALAETVVACASEVMPEVSPPEAPASAAVEDEQPPEPSDSVAPPTGWNRFRELGWSTATYAASLAQSAAEVLGSSVRDVTGVHEGLRQHARGHLIAVWIEGTSDAPSVLDQVERGLRTADMRARELAE